jgi:hypothetical protein
MRPYRAIVVSTGRPIGLVTMGAKRSFGWHEGIAVVNRYLFEINDLWTLDGSPKSNIGRWANHSCKPNAATEITQRKRVWLYAIKRIRPGEEIVYDYGEEYTRRV